MNLTFQQKIRFGFWLLTIIPIVLGVVAFRNANALVDAAKDVAHTNEVVTILEQVLSSAKDLEVAQREFILTGDDRHVAAIKQYRVGLADVLKKLRELKADDYSLTLLEDIIPQKFQEIEKTIDLRQKQGIEAASLEILANRGALAMDDLRAVVRTMIQQENHLLDQRTRTQGLRFNRTFTIIAIVLVLNVALLWSVRYVWAREDRQIRKLNEQLEQRVARRTEALQRSNEDLQQFAYVASHDLKEPMRMISSYSTLLQRRYHDKLDNDANLYIDFVIDGVRRMNVLITDLLDYSRAGELPLGSLPPVDANASVQDALTNLTATVAESQAKVTIDSLPKVAYDPARLTQVFQNLIGNALKYRGDRAPVIRIGAARTGSGIVFSVQDNGIGIEARHTEEIFGIFKRLHSSKDYEGTGIGLALTKKIVERHGGRIWVESEFGVGSTFYFDVPNWGAATSQTANS